MPEKIEKMQPPAVQEALKGLPEWSEVGEAIQRTYQFKDFVTAMEFVNKVAQHAEGMQHHPDIMIRYSRVTLTLSTHDAGGISTKDFASATVADQFASALPGAPLAAPAKPSRKKK
ncbi:4a-hydroxytetrahydrobiopterin dehydratase [Phycisphaerales bacterium]|nr:4a-hydroxytetrahydrobiopterin dehydratase [Phycisphaerales bacterium]